MAGPVESKAIAGPFVTLVAGYAAAVLIEAVPWLNEHLTADQQQNLPIIIAFALSAVASYFAPHTHRPDLAPVSPPPPPARHAQPALPQAGSS